jgi:AcrR family transcriptional regulator
MALIAQQAGMSVGQIYRYFANKEAIIRAIVEQIVEQREQQIGAVHRNESVALIARHALSSLEEEVRDNHVLMLEIAAEATRNEAVLRIVQESDLRLRQFAAATYRRQEPDLSEADAMARAAMMAALLTGTAQLRALGVAHDAQSTRQLYQRILETALSWRS